MSGRAAYARKTSDDFSGVSGPMSSSSRAKEQAEQRHVFRLVAQCTQGQFFKLVTL